MSSLVKSIIGEKSDSGLSSLSASGTNAIIGDELDSVALLSTFSSGMQAGTGEEFRIILRCGLISINRKCRFILYYDIRVQGLCA